jgi:hypothetical protein
MSTTPPAPPPGPPSAPPPSPPPAPPPGATPGAAPARKSGGGTNIWLVLFIVVGVLFVGALISPSSASPARAARRTTRTRAQKELASTKKELKDTQGELGTQQGAGEILSDLVRTGAKLADDLKACTDSARTVQKQAIDILNARQAGTDVNPLIDGLNAAIDQNEGLCNASSDSYQQFVDALNKVRNQ